MRKREIFRGQNPDIPTFPGALQLGLGENESERKEHYIRKR
jgi:hypothetical protein